MYRQWYKESLSGDPGRSDWKPVTARYLIGDVLEVLPTLEENSVDLVLTSPPFLALRSYLPADHPDKAKEGGSQSTPGAFIDWLVDVVEALDRVLAPHGSMVIELGDTYAGGNGWAMPDALIRAHDTTDLTVRGKKPRGGPWPNDKSLCLIPELFRMTLVYGFNPLTGRQTKRWRLRNVIRWVRPNPPVGSLGDKFRPATSELMVFCRTDEAGRKRYFDLDSVREPSVNPIGVGVRPTQARVSGNDINDHRDQLGPFTREMQAAGAPPLDWWNIPLLDGEEETPYGPKEPKPDTTRHLRAFNKLEAGGLMSSHAQTAPNHPGGAPPLDWWNIPPGGYQGAHYAVFPEALCVKPIKAMCPEKVCRTCGEPSRRIVESQRFFRGSPIDGIPAGTGERLNAQNIVGSNGQNTWSEYTTLGWSDCGHSAHRNSPVGDGSRCSFCLSDTSLCNNYRPGLVLDPFAGSGTTLAVAVGHGRDAIGIDLDERNARLAEERIGFFLEVVQ